jgi:hypothetical protein
VISSGRCVPSRAFFINVRYSFTLSVRYFLTEVHWVLLLFFFTRKQPLEITKLT